MSQKVLDRLKAQLGAAILETRAFRGDEEATVAPADWKRTAMFLRDDPETAMDHFIDLTAVDYPERELPRFDLLLSLRSTKTNHRVRLRTRLRDGEAVASLVGVYAGANWTEREVIDMFGIPFEGHPDPRRILMYDQFVGHPLRKDYPIERVQPLMPYRGEDNLEKLAPFGPEEGQPFARIDWQARLEGKDEQVSPAIAVQQGQKKNTSETSALQSGAPRKN